MFNLVLYIPEKGICYFDFPFGQEKKDCCRGKTVIH